MHILEVSDHVGEHSARNLILEDVSLDAHDCRIECSVVEELLSYGYEEISDLLELVHIET